MVFTSLISRLFGSFASTKFPAFIQAIINNSYVSMMKVDMSEFHKPSYYKSLNALFTRRLIKSRKFDPSESNFISPCDSFITSCGNIDYGQALQIKGFRYSVLELLKNIIDEKEKNRLENGKYINFYLSPKDYHRYHTPIDMRVKKALHVPGKLYSVNTKYLKKIPNLFIQNERVILECETMEKKLFYIVFVGALNVGKMSFVFDNRIKTNSKKEFETYYEYGDVILKKGEELGMFEMGSTIVMFFEKDFVELKCKKNKKIRFADIIAKILT